ncbi:DNA internalization-related competence protein ComEC/Rec2 [Chromobacterium haemolyticum]|uniref:DNA internalization-related competence protein ComEC/Rec2 n=1 Tax=Chromobacterium haemolyticum TaxID=394935 RepID=A0ABS3GR16_9NEIS|nr:DNA internalization-related competence protein ComEC/Rec2 [Chromobacterium haemolyticum]MBK0416194.1 DNA internalization-related competence protein ComEC/Rec2 [Chromobacterium haemolyticum]MBO0417471.1 DNA internalization-related competence protein ComEC/Rec2 [Chromobacterium haemolyticum]MBO0500662.1 DNA internalization-related competence protein ComEC/Rec2 [Chromobacterium haemolyticum]
MPVLIALLCGIAICAALPALPAATGCLGLAVGTAALAACLPLRTRPWAALIPAFLLGLGYAAWRADYRMAQQLPADWQQRSIVFVGEVRGLPQAGEYGTRLIMEVERTLTPGVNLPQTVRLTDFLQRDWPTGSRWRAEARFKRSRGTANPFGFDVEQWQWSEGVLASGSLRPGERRLEDSRAPLACVDRARAALVARIEGVLGESREAALIAALTVGAQQRVAREDWGLFAATGLTHLVSISGLHITMLAGLAAAALACLSRRLPVLGFPPRLLIAGGAFLTAAAYALLAGFSVPTQRTLFMLGVGLASLCLRRGLSPFRIWWLALAVVLLMDPFCVLAPGVWLSFGLVAALMASSIARRRAPGKWRAALAGQWAAGVCTLAPLAWWFGGIPLVSPLANALGIPYVSLLLTPLALAAALLPLEWPLHLAAWLVRGFYWGVEWFAQAPALSLAGTPLPLFLLALLGSAWLIAPRGVPGRGLAALMLLPMLAYQPPLPAQGEFRATMLDVGQGLAVLVQTRNRSLLFDTGLGGAERILLPQLRGLGVKELDGLVLSHHHSDHDGAAAELAAALPVGRVLAGQPESLPGLGLSGDGCRPGQSWAWDGVRFDVLGPPDAAPANDENAQSCILRVAGMKHALLLSGDAPEAVERMLAAQPGLRLRSTVLAAGHHGSRTSTGAAWLAAAQPEVVLISAGYLNRYRHPHPSVLRRVEEAGVAVLRTDLDGALALEFGDGVEWTCLRDSQRRYWRERGDCGEPP